MLCKRLFWSWRRGFWFGLIFPTSGISKKFCVFFSPAIARGAQLHFFKNLDSSIWCTKRAIITWVIKLCLFGFMTFSKIGNDICHRIKSNVEWCSSETYFTGCPVYEKLICIMMLSNQWYWLEFTTTDSKKQIVFFWKSKSFVVLQRTLCVNLTARLMSAPCCLCAFDL